MSNSEGWRLAEQGAEEAVSHAGLYWARKAYEALLYVAASCVEFTSEDVKQYAECNLELSSPPDSRAWGGIFRKASQAGTIRRVGWKTLTDPRCHARPGAVWTKA